MHDWFSVGALFVPLWVLLGAAPGFYGIKNMKGKMLTIVWIVLVAFFAWRVGVQQMRDQRDLTTFVHQIPELTVEKLSANPTRQEVKAAVQSVIERQVTISAKGQFSVGVTVIPPRSTPSKSPTLKRQP